MQYPLNEIAAFKTVNIADTTNYRKSLINELSRLLSIMDKLKIIDVNATYGVAGIDMKIYFGDYRALLYVDNIAEVKDGIFKNYIQSGERFDESWYYVKDH